MFLKRLGATAAPVGLLLLLSAPAQAKPIELNPYTAKAGGQFQLADADLGLEKHRAELALLDEQPTTLDRSRTRMSDLQTVEDFHPETDRWTERNNRIRITVFSGAWFFSNELRIHHDVPIGIRLNWEVPGFISIRFDAGAVPWARMEVKGATSANPRSSRWMDGIVSNFNMSLGIFNPELSVSGLAFWAGFGFGAWFYNFDENDVFGDGTGVNASFDDMNISGNVFVELDYKIADIFHIGLGFRFHLVLASHTNDGRFYDFNGVTQTQTDGNGQNIDRNDGAFDDAAFVTEITLNLSVLF